MKTTREFLEYLRDYNTWDDFERPRFLENLNNMADDSFDKRTIEGYLASLLVYHQLCEEYLRVLIKKSHFLVQCLIFPYEMEDKELSEKMMFGDLIKEYERTLQFEGSSDLVKKCRELNKIRIDMAHKITQKPSMTSISRQAKKGRRLLDEIWELFEEIVEQIRLGIKDQKKNVDECGEAYVDGWVSEERPHYVVRDGELKKVMPTEE